MMIVVLDAMGVIYSVGDDVRDLLCPFIEEKGGITDFSKIWDLYHSASLGKMPASEFWKAVGVSSELEDEYLRRHELTDGLIDFLKAVNALGHEIWCLSNDLSEWSEKLRTRFGLMSYFQGFVISGDIGHRKPEPFIYDYLISKVGAEPPDMVLVDDALKNLDTALKLKFNTILFGPNDFNLIKKRHVVTTTFNEILSLVR